MAPLRFALPASLNILVLVAAISHAADQSPQPGMRGQGIGVVASVESFTLPQPLATSSDVRIDRVTAVGMRAEALPMPASGADIVVVVDTSASQTGGHRTRSFDVVRGLFGRADAKDRLRVAAVDSLFQPVSEAFETPDPEHLRRSLDQLDTRTPLGASDVIAGLETAAGMFRDEARTRAIVYVGDGPNWAGVEAAEFARVVDHLRSQRISVSVAGIGPDVNWTLLAALAGQTGGVLIIPDADESGTDVGRTLAASVAQPVAWPLEQTQHNGRPDAPSRILPTRLPPLRMDRESIVLIAGDSSRLEETLSFETSAGDRLPVAVLVPELESTNANAFLGALFRNADPTDGLFLPLLGSQGVEAAREHFLAESRSLAELSRQAGDAGMRDSAIRLAEASLRTDPGNPVAARVRTVALQDTGSPSTLPPPAPAVDEPPPAAIPKPADDGDANALAEMEQMRRVRGQQLEQETAVTIRDARQLLATDPDEARSILKGALNVIRDSADLEPAARERLERQLEMRIRESIVRSRDKMECDLAAERRAAIGRERARLTETLHRREERLKQLVERYNALVDEGIRQGYAGSERYPKHLSAERAEGYEVPTTALTEAERQLGDEIAREAPQLWSGYPIPMTARAIGRTAGLVARTLDYDAENFRTRRDQERGFMDALHCVDVAAIPLPDEPSIIYPTAARWREINSLRAEYRTPALNTLNANEQRVYDALLKTVDDEFRFEQNSLTDLATAIEDRFGITVILDGPQLDEGGLDANEAIVTRKSRPASLRAALRQILSPLNLTYLVKDEALVITTRDAAELPQNMVVRPYAVGDLVMPVGPMSSVNPFNLGGTNQTQQNNALNPGPPPGPCWVAREVYGPHDPRWLVFRAWMLTESPAWFRDAYIVHGEACAEWIRGKPVVKSLIRLAMDTIVERRTDRDGLRNGHFQLVAAQDRLAATADRGSGDSVTGPPKGAARSPGRRVGLPHDIIEAADMASALADYLAMRVAGDGDTPTEGPDHAVAGGSAVAGPADAEVARRLAQVRVTAADLGQAGAFDKAADLISAAIRAGYAEPWMYESLALALEAAGGSRSEIERVLLSSEDFATSSSDLLALAHLLARMNFDAQALTLCRKVVRLEPMNRDAFALAMTVASRADDLHALAWACPGVLASDWPPGEQDIAVRAGRLAKATLKRFEDADQSADAMALKTTLDAAVARDLVIRCTWSGDAEVDLVVEEPPGTLCSVDAPVTTSGGTLISREIDESGTQVHEQTYSAALAFAGGYRARLRKLFGDIDGDTVQVSITAHKGTPAERTETRHVRLLSTDHLVQVDLGEGRRRQALPDALLAQDIAAQRALGKAVLRQQLELLSDEETAETFAASRSDARAAGGTTGLPFYGTRQPVGYQPVITTLPEGLNFSARAVVSADRRYVRVTATPLFTGIGAVTSFTFQGGGGGGGMGGGGMGGMGGGGMGGMGGGGMGGMGGGGMGGMGGMGGGGMGGMGGGMGGMGMCWVAREVYGSADPRWLVFRGWLLDEAPDWLRATYAAHGEAVAAWLRDKPAAKAVLRGLMDRVVAGRPLPSPGH